MPDVRRRGGRPSDEFTRGDRERLMKLDKTAQELDLTSIPAEFRENYKFLCELINCRQKNSAVTERLEQVIENRLCNLRGKLNRRQLGIVTRFLKGNEADESECLTPPVPPNWRLRFDSVNAPRGFRGKPKPSERSNDGA